MNDPLSIQVVPNTAFIVVEQSLSAGLVDLAGRVLLTVAHCAEVLALSHASASGNIGFVVPAAQHEQVTALLQQRFAADFAHPNRLRLVAVNDVALVRVGEDHPPSVSAAATGIGTVQRAVDALAAQGHNILMMVRGWRTATLVVQAPAAAIWEAVRTA